MTITRFPVSKDEMTFSAIRAQGTGGQNVNKVSSAIHLRYSIPHSSLPDEIKERLLALRDHRITDDGVVVIKAQSSRSQEKNKLEAIDRLQALVDSVSMPRRVRKATRPTLGSKRRRLEGKAVRARCRQTVPCGGICGYYLSGANASTLFATASHAVTKSATIRASTFKSPSYSPKLRIL
jgi:ribosome-associated protein